MQSLVVALVGRCDLCVLDVHGNRAVFPLVAVVLLGEKVKPLIYCDMRVRDLDIGRASFKYLIKLYLRKEPQVG